MKSKILKQDKLLRLVAARLFSLFVLITIMQSALGATLLIEHFDEKVPDYSPIGNAPGWRVLVVKGGVVFDCTTNLPGFIYDYPRFPQVMGGPEVVLANGALVFLP